MALDRSGAQVRVDPGATRRIFCADDCSPNLWRSRTLHSPARGHGSALNLKTGTKQHEFGTSLEPFRRPSVPWASVRVESRQIFKVLDGGRTRARTWDPLIKSHQIALIYQAHFDISSVRSGIEPERKLENVETRFTQRSDANSRCHPCPPR